MRSEPVLVSGATGYVGGRLVPLLLKSGYRVRVLGRSLSKLTSRSWAGHTQIEMVQGDFLDYPSLEKAVEGCWAAFYLVHSMDPRHKDFVMQPGIWQRRHPVRVWSGLSIWAVSGSRESI